MEDLTIAKVLMKRFRESDTLLYNAHIEKNPDLQIELWEQHLNLFKRTLDQLMRSPELQKAYRIIKKDLPQDWNGWKKIQL